MFASARATVKKEAYGSYLHWLGETLKIIEPGPFGPSGKLMFNFFKKKTPEQLAVRELKRFRKRILKEGGPEKICYVYWKFLESHTLFKELGIAAEEDAPCPKMMAILSSLDLLNSWKKTADEAPNIDPNIKEIMALLSKRVYVAGLLTFNHAELASLHQKAGGVPGQITADSDAAVEIETALRAEVERRRIEAEAAWLRWKETDFDVFDAIRSA